MAGEILSDVTVRQRTVLVALSWDDLKAAIARQAMDDADLEGLPGAGGVTAEVTISPDGGDGTAAGQYIANITIVLPV